MIKKYGNLMVVETDNLVDVEKCDIAKITLNSSIENDNLMREKGFKFADRTIGVCIHISKLTFNFDKLIRLQIEESKEYRAEIEKIALKSFPYDRRFHLRLDYNDKDLFELIITDRIKNINKVLVAKYKNIIVGFLELKEIDKETLFVNLAAVDEKYRLTGAAMSLYSKALQIARIKGYKKLNGRVSTKNTPVINLYSYFDAYFENPLDIYIKEYDREK